MIMSRRRLLLVWAILFTVVVLACIYLPYQATNSKDRFVIPTQSKYNHHQDIPTRTSPTYEVHLKKPTTTQSTTPSKKTTTAGPTKLKLCEPELLVGAVYCNKTVPQMQEVVEQLSSDYDGLVKKGGAFTPTGCIAKNKLAIIIPYRNRSQHLRIFLRHMHPIMQRQMHDYRIFVVEQAGNYSFNRAQLINIGFLEALKISDYQCFVFHDVDHILENDQNDYGCPESPKLLGVSVDRFNRRFPYQKYFGGVGAFSKDQFEKMNGYSNLFWGWGGEDDDAYNR
ncbi:beta-1,4-N-acetylgalactosaminyltransferase bre-4 [Paramuricea clavata]|nr:beta-1,4-N-acetylgalactosaminyltransferase bre-4 [Paramuricea clavata]